MIKTIISISIFCFTLSATTQNALFCDELNDISQLIKTEHYQSKQINDSLSKGVFNLFLKTIDKNQRFFTQEDINVFEKDRYKIDDYIKDKDCEFIKHYSKQLEKRILTSKAILEDLKTIEFDYSGKDSLYYSAEETYSYFKNKTAVIKYWNKKIRYKILRKLVENDSVLENITSNFKTLEKEIKPKIINNEICLLEELEHSKGTISKLVEVSFLDALLKYQDPHSAYFSASDKNMFEQSVSNSQLSFGISTKKKTNGDIVISYIAPGSSAFKQGEFEVNDVILALESDTKIIETYCTSNETILSFINNADSNIMTFSIKKQNGKKKTIKLKKTTIAIEDNSITGFLLNGEIKLGYINIPSFYTDMEAQNGLGVANDVAQQIYKLQRENIQGLILDLRFNGGGSMKEAMDLSGMFINRGPVAISKAKNEKNYTIRDPNRGTVFSKPIVVLINQFSASASEFFAGALQDYNSAIIVGSVTHGKATSQMILPLKTNNYIKLTIGQFFRVTGKSHQQLGVIPDISLPNIYDNYETQETYKSFALTNSETEVTLKHRAKPKTDMSSLKLNSAQRIDTSNAFKAIKAFNSVFVNDYVNRVGTYPLTLDYIFNHSDNYNLARDNYIAILEANLSVFTIDNTASTTRILDYNADDKTANANYRQKLKEDPYIQEAYAIINDIIQQ